MKKIIYGLAVMVLLVSWLVGCAPTPAPEEALPSTIRLGTREMGSTDYGIAVAIAEVVGKYTPMKVEVQAIGGATVWAPLMLTGEIDMAHTAAPDTAGSYFGRTAQPFIELGPIPRFMLCCGHGGQMSFFTRPDTGIKEVLDLRGKRVYGYAPQSVTLEILSRGVIKWYGLDPDKDLALFAPFASSKDLVNHLAEGKIDAYFWSLGGSHGVEAQKRCGLVVLPIDPRAAEYVESEDMPTFHGEIIRPAIADLYGVPHGIPVIAYRSISQVRTDLADEAVYLICKAIFEHNEELGQINIKAGEYKIEGALSFMPIPVHPGAIKYYKEVGVWTEEHEKKQQDLMKRHQELFGG